MKSKVVLGVLVAIGIFALSATAAQAGSGGFPSPLTSFFVCHGINGDDPGQVVDVQSSFFGLNPQNVRIGNATLACAFAKLFRGETEIAPNPLNTHQQLKCYTLSVARQPGASPPTRYSVTDELLGVDADVHASQLQYICAPASFTIAP